MPKYTIDGKVFRSDTPLSDDELDELAGGAAAPEAPAAPEQDRSAWDIAKGAVNAVRDGGFTEATTDQDRKDFDTAVTLPKRGIKGAAVAAERGLHGDDLATSLQRGTAATKEGYQPKDGEKLADFAAEMADPAMMPVNEMGGEAISLAGKAAAPLAKWGGKQAANLVEVFTGVNPHNTIALAKNPLKVLFADGLKKSGKAFQKAKQMAGVTPEEERLIAQVDLGGYKTQADKVAKKVKDGVEPSIGELLAGKKAAGKITTKGEGSAKAIYGKDHAKFSEMIEDVAPDVAKAQAEVAKGKTRQAFLNPLPYNKSGKAAVLRTIGAGGLAASGMGPLALAFSPMTAGIATLLASGVGHGTKAAASSPTTRAALIAAFKKSKGK